MCGVWCVVCGAWCVVRGAWCVVGVSAVAHTLSLSHTHTHVNACTGCLSPPCLPRNPHSPHSNARRPWCGQQPQSRNPHTHRHCVRRRAEAPTGLARVVVPLVLGVGCCLARASAMPMHLSCPRLPSWQHARLVIVIALSFSNSDRTTQQGMEEHTGGLKLPDRTQEMVSACHVMSWAKVAHPRPGQACPTPSCWMLRHSLGHVHCLYSCLTTQRCCAAALDECTGGGGGGAAACPSPSPC